MLLAICDFQIDLHSGIVSKILLGKRLHTIFEYEVICDWLFVFDGFVKAGN